MINPLDLLLYIAITVILSLAIGAYIGVALILSEKVYCWIGRRTGYRSMKPEILGILFLLFMISPLLGTTIYLVSLTVAS